VIAALLVGVVRGITIHFMPAPARHRSTSYVSGVAGASARAARRAYREIRMMTASSSEKIPTLAVASLALIALPFVLKLLGSLAEHRDHGVDVAIATMG